jgi:hypothetical protein
MSDQLLIVLTRLSGEDEWPDWTFEDPRALFALLGRDLVEECQWKDISPEIDWQRVDVCVVHGQPRDPEKTGQPGDPWKTIGELLDRVPAGIDSILLLHANRPPRPTWADDKVRQMGLAGAGARKAREVLGKCRVYGLGDGDEGDRNKNIIRGYVEAAGGQGDYEKGLAEVRRLLLRPGPGDRIAIIRHKLGPRLFNGLAAEVDYVANCMRDGETDVALRTLQGLLDDYRREAAGGKLQLASFAEWVELLQMLVGGSLLSAAEEGAVYSMGGLVEEHWSISNEEFRRAWEDLILLAGLRPRDEAEQTRPPRLERDEDSPVTRFMEHLDGLRDKLRPGATEEVKRLLDEDVWTPFRGRAWAVGGENVTSFPAWFRQLDATLDELRRHLSR